MKKILTLLLAAGAFATAAHAQTSREEARRVILGGGNGSPTSGGSGNGRDVILGGGNGDNSRTYPGDYPNSGSRQAEIDRINRDYEAKIQSIRNNPYLSYEEKERAIRQLEKDRQRRINSLHGDYDRNGDYNDRDYDRHDNGKHKGWYKKQKNKNWKNGKNRG